MLSLPSVGAITDGQSRPIGSRPPPPRVPAVLPSLPSVGAVSDSPQRPHTPAIAARLGIAHYRWRSEKVLVFTKALPRKTLCQGFGKTLCRTLRSNMYGPDRTGRADTPTTPPPPKTAGSACLLGLIARGRASDNHHHGPKRTDRI